MLKVDRNVVRNIRTVAVCMAADVDNKTAYWNLKTFKLYLCELVNINWHDLDKSLQNRIIDAYELA